MSFIKTGEAPIAVIYCPCGGQIDPKTKKCTKCGKPYGESNQKTDQSKTITNQPKI